MKTSLCLRLWSVAATVFACCLVLLPVVKAQRWERLGPEGGQVLTLAESRDGTLYLGTPDGHVFASVDAGENWELRGRASARLDGVIQALGVDASDPRTLYAGVWHLNEAAGGGVFRSADGGRTWAAAGLTGQAVRALVQSASEPQVWIAGTRNGVFRTRDAGAHWERISPLGDLELMNIDSIAIDPRESGTIYVGTYHLPWKTTDGGKTWTSIHTGMIDDSDVMSIQIDRENPARIFASACSGIYRSEDAGATWVKLQGIPYTSRRTQQILQDPVDAKVVYAATTEGLWLSRDAGENWARVTSRDTVVNAIAVPSVRKGARLLIGTDEGILASDDAEKTFVARNRGFSHQVISALAQDPSAAEHLLILLETPRQRLFESSDGGKNWRLLEGALPAAGAQRIFGGSSGWWAAVRGGGAARYDAAARVWKTLRFVPEAPTKKQAATANSGRARTAAKLPQVLEVAERFGVIYVATTDGVWSGASSGFVLRRFDSAKLTGPVRDISLGSGNCFVMSSSKMQCSDSPASWKEIAGPPDQDVLWAEQMDLGDDPEMFVGTSKGVFTTRLGEHSGWKLLQAGLPAAKAGRVVISGAMLGVAMGSGGFYASEDRGKTWTRMDGAGESGVMAGVVGDGAGGFVMASRSEGVMRWSSSKQARVPKRE